MFFEDRKDAGSNEQQVFAAPCIIGTIQELQFSRTISGNLTAKTKTICAVFDDNLVSRLSSSNTLLSLKLSNFLARILISQQGRKSRPKIQRSQTRPVLNSNLEKKVDLGPNEELLNESSNGLSILLSDNVTKEERMNLYERQTKVMKDVIQKLKLSTSTSQRYIDQQRADRTRLTTLQAENERMTKQSIAWRNDSQQLKTLRSQLAALRNKAGSASPTASRPTSSGKSSGIRTRGQKGARGADRPGRSNPNRLFRAKAKALVESETELAKMRMRVKMLEENLKTMSQELSESEKRVEQDTISMGKQTKELNESLQSCRKQALEDIAIAEGKVTGSKAQVFVLERTLEESQKKVSQWKAMFNALAYVSVRKVATIWVRLHSLREVNNGCRRRIQEMEHQISRMADVMGSLRRQVGDSQTIGKVTTQFRLKTRERSNQKRTAGLAEAHKVLIKDKLQWKEYKTTMEENLESKEKEVAEKHSTALKWISAALRLQEALQAQIESNKNLKSQISAQKDSVKYSGKLRESLRISRVDVDIWKTQAHQHKKKSAEIRKKLADGESQCQSIVANRDFFRNRTFELEKLFGQLASPRETPTINGNVHSNLRMSRGFSLSRPNTVPKDSKIRRHSSSVNGLLGASYNCGTNYTQWRPRKLSSQSKINIL
eukprot:43563_1